MAWQTVLSSLVKVGAGFRFTFFEDMEERDEALLTWPFAFKYPAGAKTGVAHPTFTLQGSGWIWIPPGAQTLTIHHVMITSNAGQTAWSRAKIGALTSTEANTNATTVADAGSNVTMTFSDVSTVQGTLVKVDIELSNSSASETTTSTAEPDYILRSRFGF